MELISKKIKDIEVLINNTDFFRVHNSYLVNTTYITEYVKNEGHYIVLENNISIPVSRAKKNDLMNLISN